MGTEPPAQPKRQAEELAGDLQVPDLPVLSAGYAHIFHGVWTRPDGVQVEVAIKELKILIPKNRQSDLEALQRRTDIRMRREVLAWSQTTHENLHPLLGYRSKPHPRLISPWCRHGNLTDYLVNNPGLSRLHKLRLIYQTGRALFHLHSQAPPICHADIKPENVLINDDYEASLSDFGLSRVLQDFDESSGLTTTEAVKGTLNYMAGELFIGEKAKPGRETDVYAFGGLILTVMSGKPPYFKFRGFQIMVKATQYQPPTSEDHPNLPPSDPLWILIRRCWSKIPSARPTMPEVLGELWGHASAIETAQPPSAPLRYPHRVNGKEKASHPHKTEERYHSRATRKIRATPVFTSSEGEEDPEEAVAAARRAAAKKLARPAAASAPKTEERSHSRATGTMRATPVFTSSEGEEDPEEAVAAARRSAAKKTKLARPAAAKTEERSHSRASGKRRANQVFTSSEEEDEEAVEAARRATARKKKRARAA